MQAGQELDALIAEKVMGWEVLEEEAFKDRTRMSVEDRAKGDRYHTKKGWFVGEELKACEQCGDLPTYSTAIADAWQVVEKLPYPVGIHRYPDRTYKTTVFLSEFHVIETAPTAPLSICLAALKAVGYEAPQE